MSSASWARIVHGLIIVEKNLTRSSSTAKNTACPSYFITFLRRESICWWLINHFYVVGPKAIEFGEITQNKGHYRRLKSFKVTDFGTNRKPICNFLLAINSNLPPTIHHFQVMADYCSHFASDGVALLYGPWGWIPVSISISDILLKLDRLVCILSQKVSVYLKPPLCNGPQSDRIGEITQHKGHYAE